MTEPQTWNPALDDEMPPFWWLAQHWHWLWRLDGLLTDREHAYWCARMQRFEHEVGSGRVRA